MLQLTPDKENIHGSCAHFHCCVLTPWMFTLTVGFLQSLFSLTPSVLCGGTTAHYSLRSMTPYVTGFLLFLDILITVPAVVLARPLWSFHSWTTWYSSSLVGLAVLFFLSCTHAWTEAMLISPHAGVETKTQTHPYGSQQGSWPDIIPQRSGLY